MKSKIIKVAGSYAIKFEPNHSCGKVFGFGVYIAEDLFNDRNFSAGGVMSYRDIEKLYKWSIEERKEHEKYCHKRHCNCVIDK